MSELTLSYLKKFDEKSIRELKEIISEKHEISLEELRDEIEKLKADELIIGNFLIFDTPEEVYYADPESENHGWTEVFSVYEDK